MDRNVGLQLRVSPLISQTCWRAFQMQFFTGHCCPAKLTWLVISPRRDCFSLAVTSHRSGCDSPFPITVSPVFLQLEPRFLALFALRRFRATLFPLSSPTVFGAESDVSRVWSWSSFIFQLPIGTRVETRTVHLAEALKTPAAGLAALYPLTGISALPSLSLPNSALWDYSVSRIKDSVFVGRFRPDSAGLAAARPRRGNSAVTTPQRGAGDLCLLTCTLRKTRRFTGAAHVR
jgi:hypothetical protein